MTARHPEALSGERGIGGDFVAYRAAAAPRDAWPTAWPEQLHGRDRVWRADVFAVAEAWRDGRSTARELLTAVLVWGHGANGYGPTRLGWTLGTPDLDRRLDDALSPLRGGPAVPLDVLLDSYRALRDPKRSRLVYMRASFFTKLLYFAGYRRGAGGVQPLVWTPSSQDGSRPGSRRHRRLGTSTRTGGRRSGAGT